LVFEYENIVIGSSLKAVLYAYAHNYPIFFSEQRRPFRFDCFEPEVDLSALKIPNETESLTTFEGVKLLGARKELLWERLLFLLSLDGKVPLSTLCQSMRYDGNTMVCANEYSKIAEIAFNECHYFGDDHCHGFAKDKELTNDEYICYDYIAFNKGGKHEIDYIKTEDDFVSEIWFYPSERIDGATAVKDACAVSLLSKEQMQNFDYSETMARFKTVAEMESRGMKGVFNGYGPNGKPKHYRFRTTHVRRRSARRRMEAPNDGNHDTPSTTTAITEEDLVANLSDVSLIYNRFLK